jgi:4-amino-4-deoxy-L-arabinose transferase-like glycosyltransferase
MPLPRRTLISFIAIAVLAGCFFFWRLGSNPLEKWDEAIHAQVTHEMLQSRNWLELTWNHNAYFRKPPLRFWLQGIASATFGESEWTIRFWSATAGVLTTLLIALWAWQATKKTSAAWFATLAFLSGRYLFYHAFRTGETDGLLTFFSLLALWSYWRSWLKPRWLLLTALALGLTFLTKFTAVGFAGLAILLHLALTKRFKMYPKKVWLQAIGLGVLIVAPWILAQLAIRGSAFIQEYVSEDVVTRATKNLYGFTAGPDWYWGIFLKRAFPMTAFVFPALAWSAWRTVKRDQLQLLFLLFTGVTVAVLSLNASKIDWYLLPIYPVVMLVTGVWMARWFRWPMRWPMLGLVLWGTAMAAWGNWTYAWNQLQTFTATHSGNWLAPFSAVSHWNRTWSGIVVTLTIGVASIAVVWFAKKHDCKSLWFGFCTVLLSGMLGVTMFSLRVEFTKPRGEPLLREARAIIQRDKPATLYLANVYLAHEPTVLYYLGNEPGTKLQTVKVPTEIPAGALTLEGVKRGIPLLPGNALLSSINFRLLRSQ